MAQLAWLIKERLIRLDQIDTYFFSLAQVMLGEVNRTDKPRRHNPNNPYQRQLNASRAGA